MTKAQLQEVIKKKLKSDAIEILPACIENIDKELKEHAENAETEWCECEYKKPRRRSPEVVYANNPDLFYRICKHYKDNGFKVEIHSIDLVEDFYEKHEREKGVDYPPYYYYRDGTIKAPICGWEKRVEWDENFDLKEFKNGLTVSVKYPPNIWINLCWNN